MLTPLLTACSLDKKETETRWLVLAVDENLAQGGLVETLVAPFEKENGVKVKILPVDTETSLKYARNGGVDVLLVSAGTEMQKLAGEPPVIPAYADPPLPTATPASVPTATPTALPFDVPFAERKLVLWSKLVLVGPANDPAQAGKEVKITNALQNVIAANAPIIAASQESGINLQTDRIWGLIGRTETAQRGKGFRIITGNAVDGLKEAEKVGGYIILPLNVYLNNRTDGKSKVIFEKDLTLFLGYEATIRNYISIPGQDITLSRKFVAYLLSPAVQNLIETYKKPLSETPLFYTKDLPVFIPK